MPDAGARTWAAVAHDRPMRAAGMNAPTPPTSSMASGELERLEDLVAMGTKTIFRHLGAASADATEFPREREQNFSADRILRRQNSP